MSWVRRGLLFALPQGGLHPRMVTHAANPLAHPIGGDLFRIFFNARDAGNRASIGAVDVDLVRRAVVKVYHEPCAVPGPTGSFYADGISNGGWLDRPDGRSLVFMGWRLIGGGRWCGSIGRWAMTGDSWPVDSDPALLLAPDDKVDPVSLSYPCAWHDGTHYRMLYESTVSGDSVVTTRHPLNSAVSADGDDWHRCGVALAPVAGITTGYARPSVLAVADGYRLWFSQTGADGARYRIGCATSSDGVRWTLASEAGLDPVGDGWESAMVCYPFVFTHDGQRYLLYNGNGYGSHGIGLAEWQET